MPNHLATESSPYLRQHADNPVQWRPWGHAALALAKRENRPILLSIGYSACHWCHVMAHECFEDPATAQVMNELFVNIKVDREERPDLDKIYQLAHQALTRRGGGWPLTVFLTPGDRLPFFAGTYFPREARQGLPAFVDVLRRVRNWYDQRRTDVDAQNAILSDVLHAQERAEPVAGSLHAGPLQAALAHLEQAFDATWGGFGPAPKFPHVGGLGLLLHLDAHVGWAEHSEAQRPTLGLSAQPTQSPRAMAVRTLERMAAGGLYDQLGGGFCRYSVDAEWAIPHFEKMLYDNAGLLPLYARLAAETDDDTLRAVAEGIARWLRHEMAAPDGGYYAALDADSEGEEGHYYLWQRDEVAQRLTPEEFALAARHWGLDRPPNFEERAWHLIRTEPLADSARALGLYPTEAAARIESARRKLLVTREQRVHPGLDNKRLTAWNALLASGCAQAARWLRRNDCGAQARAIVDFLHTRAWRDRRLYASVQNGQARFPAYLDDHAFLLDALLETLRLDADPSLLAWAIELAELLLAHFEDREHGGFYFTADDHETLPVRPRSVMDEAMPSGQGVAVHALLRLGHLLGDTRYLEAAERALRAAWPTMTQAPQNCATMLSALHEALQPPAQVVIRLADDASDTAWQVLARELGARDIEAYAFAPGPLPGVLFQRKPKPGGVAWLCRGSHCEPPLTTPAALRAALGLRHPT